MRVPTSAECPPKYSVSIIAKKKNLRFCIQHIVKDKVSIGAWISCIYFQSVMKSLVLIIISEFKPESLHCYK